VYFARKLLIVKDLVTTARKTKGSSNTEISSRNAIYSHEYCYILCWMFHLHFSSVSCMERNISYILLCVCHGISLIYVF